MTVLSVINCYLGPALSHENSPHKGELNLKVFAIIITQIGHTELKYSPKIFIFVNQFPFIHDILED